LSRNVSPTISPKATNQSAIPKMILINDVSVSKIEDENAGKILQK